MLTVQQPLKTCSDLIELVICLPLIYGLELLYYLVDACLSNLWIENAYAYL
jgi:hypothetical protein